MSEMSSSMVISSSSFPNNIIIIIRIIIAIVAAAAAVKKITIVPTAHAFHLPVNSIISLQRRTISTSTTTCTPAVIPANHNALQPLFANNNSKNKSNNKDDELAVEISFPTPAEAIELGIRDWPQQFHSSSWTESIIEGGIATRYILDGNGRLSITYYDNNDPGGQCRTMNNVRVYPGTLIEVNGEATLQWTVDDSNVGMIVLTPTYEEGGKLALVGAALMVFCAGLIIGSTTGSL